MTGEADSGGRGKKERSFPCHVGDYLLAAVGTVAIVFLALSWDDGSIIVGMGQFVPLGISGAIVAVLVTAGLFPANAEGIRRRLFLAMSCVALATAILGVAMHGEAYERSPLVAPLARLLAGLLLLSGMLWSAHALTEPIKRSIRRRWWNMGRQDATKPPKWGGILDMLCNNDCDPMQLEEDGEYPDGAGELCIAFSVASAGVVMSVLALGVLLNYVLYPRVPNILLNKTGTGDLANLSGNLTAYLALIAAAISIVFTYQQLRAKVRADSRQAWVTRVRKLMADVLANIHDVSRRGDDSPQFNCFNKSRTRLELHLNPAEADHRLLMLLIRACVLPGLRIDNDRETARQLVSVMDACTEERRRRFDKESFDVLSRTLNAYLDRAPESAEQQEGFQPRDLDRIVSFMFKLSHAILKREWERVRHTR